MAIWTPWSSAGSGTIRLYQEFTSGRHKRMSRDRTAHQAKARGGCMDEFSIYALSAVGLWLVLQILALWKLGGMWRKTAWLSAAVMGLALVVAILGVLSGSRSEEHTSELQSLMRISYAVFCLKKQR